MFIVFSNFAHSKLNSWIELLLPQQTATSSSWAENSEPFFTPFSLTSYIQFVCKVLLVLPSEYRWNVIPFHPPHLSYCHLHGHCPSVLDYQSLPTGALALVSYSLFQSSSQTDPFKTQVRSCWFNACISLGVKAEVLPIAMGSKGYSAPIPIPPPSVTGTLASLKFLSYLRAFEIALSSVPTPSLPW